MIFMTGAIIVGVVLGALIVQFVPRNVLEWSVLGLGAAALFFMIPGLVATLIPGDTMFSPAISIPLVVVCLVCGIGAVLKSYRTWRVWLVSGWLQYRLCFGWCLRSAKYATHTKAKYLVSQWLTRCHSTYPW